MYTFDEAVEYLKKNPQTLEYYQRKGWLLPDMRYSKSRMYHKETLDAFRAKYLTESHLPTMPEIAKRFGIGLQCVKYNFRKKRKVEPKGQRNHAMTFDWDTVYAIAKEENWQPA